MTIKCRQTGMIDLGLAVLAGSTITIIVILLALWPPHLHGGTLDDLANWLQRWQTLVGGALTFGAGAFALLAAKQTIAAQRAEAARNLALHHEGTLRLLTTAVDVVFLETELLQQAMLPDEWGMVHGADLINDKAGHIETRVRNMVKLVYDRPPDEGSVIAKVHELELMTASALERARKAPTVANQAEEVGNAAVAELRAVRRILVGLFKAIGDSRVALARVLRDVDGVSPEAVRMAVDEQTTKFQEQAEIMPVRPPPRVGAPPQQA